MPLNSPYQATERQARFRAEYEAAISPAYNGFLHIGVMYAVGIAIIAWCVSHLQSPTWEWLLILPIAIAGNFVEWGMHRYVMHRRIDVFALRAIYERHTRQHHQYFTDSLPTIDGAARQKQFRIVFFPWRVLSVLTLSGALLGWITAQLLGVDAGYMVPITMVGHYMLYETFHYCCHVPENRFVEHMPFINTIRRHHAAHHNLGIMMRRNMNLTFPLADWVLGTSDLNRGLLGTLFNGYSEQHVREELKPVIARFKADHSRVTLDGPQLTQDETQVVDGLGPRKLMAG
jgi:hypothetical protein